MRKVLITVLSLLFLISCTKQESEGTSSSTGGGSNSSSEFRSLCGVVVNGKVIQPVKASEGEKVTVASVLSSTSLAIKKAGQKDDGPILLSLHGIKPSASADNAAALAKLKSLVSGTMYLYMPSSDCSMTFASGGKGMVGQLYTSNGTSVVESLIKAGVVDVTPNDVCSGVLIGSCLTGIKETLPDNAGTLDEFLWKPVAESDGKLAIHTGPYGTNVTVNGEVGSNKGPGNGFGSLARFSKPGCGYGGATVTVTNRSGLPYTVGGQTSFKIPNPCGRHCLKGGQIVACSK